MLDMSTWNEKQWLAFEKAEEIIIRKEEMIVAQLEDAFQRGKEECKKQIASKLLSQKIDITTISLVTRLREDEILDLRNRDFI